MAASSQRGLKADVTTGPQNARVSYASGKVMWMPQPVGPLGSANPSVTRSAVGFSENLIVNYGGEVRELTEVR